MKMLGQENENAGIFNNNNRSVFLSSVLTYEDDVCRVFASWVQRDQQYYLI